MDQFANYSHALAALAIWAIMVPVLSMLSTRGRTPETRSDCGKPIRDYSNKSYRGERAFMNAVEVSGPFIAATLAAILAGGTPFWVNTFASVFILARIVMAAVHIGTEIQPARSAMFVVGLVCILGLAIQALMAVFF
jgi:uncharacterized MAPEG superfamily protein